MTTRVSFPSKTGTSTEGELAVPKDSEKAPAVVLIQEYWGVNDHVRSLVTRLSDKGFVVLAPDLYHGKVTKDASEAATLMGALDMQQALAEIAGAVAFVQEHPRGNGKAAVMGFCMGGAYTLASAASIGGLSAAVAFYGVPPADKVDYSKVKAPVLAHFAKNDDWASADKARAIKAEIEKGGGRMELHVYDAGHAFMNDTRPEAHSPENAKVAWERTIAFLKKHLG